MVAVIVTLDAPAPCQIECHAVGPRTLPSFLPLPSTRTLYPPNVILGGSPSEVVFTKFACPCSLALTVTGPAGRENFVAFFYQPPHCFASTHVPDADERSRLCFERATGAESQQVVVRLGGGQWRLRHAPFTAVTFLRGLLPGFLFVPMCDDGRMVDMGAVEASALRGVTIAATAESPPPSSPLERKALTDALRRLRSTLVMVEGPVRGYQPRAAALAALEVIEHVHAARSQEDATHLLRLVLAEGTLFGLVPSALHRLLTSLSRATASSIPRGNLECRPVHAAHLLLSLVDHACQITFQVQNTESATWPAPAVLQAALEAMLAADLCRALTSVLAMVSRLDVAALAAPSCGAAAHFAISPPVETTSGYDIALPGTGDVSLGTLTSAAAELSVTLLSAVRYQPAGSVSRGVYSSLVSQLLPDQCSACAAALSWPDEKGRDEGWAVVAVNTAMAVDATMSTEYEGWCNASGVSGVSVSRLLLALLLRCAAPVPRGVFRGRTALDTAVSALASWVTRHRQALALVTRDHVEAMATLACQLMADETGLGQSSMLSDILRRLPDMEDTTRAWERIGRQAKRMLESDRHSTALPMQHAISMAVLSFDLAPPSRAGACVREGCRLLVRLEACLRQQGSTTGALKVDEEGGIALAALRVIGRVLHASARHAHSCPAADVTVTCLSTAATLRKRGCVAARDEFVEAVTPLLQDCPAVRPLCRILALQLLDACALDATDELLLMLLLDLRQEAGGTWDARLMATPHPLAVDKRCSVAPYFGCWHKGCTNMLHDREASLSLMKCALCLRAKYCSRECQVAAWSAGHCAACRAWRASHT